MGVIAGNRLIVAAARRAAIAVTPLRHATSVIEEPLSDPGDTT
jgi:hypothetical protein